MLGVSRESPCHFGRDVRTPCRMLAMAGAELSESLGSSTVMICVDANTSHEHH